MSSGLPYLNKLRKPELIEFAEKTDLQEYVHMIALSNPTRAVALQDIPALTLACHIAASPTITRLTSPPRWTST
jgi:hypothetical protein